ncbi:MAG: hypothetical protein V3R99_07550 [Thermoguttaceae bacterium]
MRTVIASDSGHLAERIQAMLTRNGLPCPTGHVVPLDSAAQRAGRVVPELLVFVLPQDIAAGREALRETCGMAPNAYCLVIGPTDDAQLILQTLREGADEYLDEASLEMQLAAAIVRLKTKRSSRPAPERTGRVISVLAPSGGSGSSTIAANISTVLADKHGECGLIDLKLAAGDLASMLDLKPTHSLADLCERLGRVDQSMFQQFFVRHASGVHLLAAPARFADIERVTCKGVRRMLAMARARFPYVVADLDNAFDAEQVETLWQSDVILLVLRLDYTSIRNAKKVIDNLAATGIGMERVEMVVNGYGQARQLDVRQAEEALGVKLRHRIPNDPASVNRAINKGVPVVLLRPSARISKSIRNLAESVNGQPPHTMQ